VSSAIETRGLAYRAGKDFEIESLDLTVPEGSIYGFLGPNGSGKTTTIRLLLGMLRARAGTVRVLGRAVPGDMPAILAETGYVPERPHLYPHLTVAEAIRFHAAFFRTFDTPYAAELRQGFGLPADRHLSGLSKGETGKLHVLLALAQKPRLLVLDEPTDGLDPVVRRDVLAALLDFCAQRTATVFISSHLVHELERVCDWVGVLDDGKLVAELPMQDFKGGIKRVRLAGAPADVREAPFAVLSRETVGSEQLWVVRGGEAQLAPWLGARGAQVREIMDLDLEEGFVELLRSSRAPAS